MVQMALLKANNPSQAQLISLLEYYQNGRLSEAEKLATSITQEFPKHQFAWKVLGAVLSATGRKSKAVDANQKAVTLSPQDTEAHSNLGNSLKELGRLDEAEACYTQAIALKPDFIEAHSNLGVTLQELGRLDEAEASYTQAIALKPDYAEAHSNLGVTLQELGRLDEAEASNTRAIALKPDYVQAHYNLGNTLKEMGKLEEAEASYTQAIVLKPDYAEAHYNLGNTLKELGRLDEAEACYKKTIALNPGFVKAYSNLGNALKELGRLEEAEESYRQAIALKPDYAEAHNNLGVTLQELRRLDEAEESYAQAIAARPDYAEAHENLVDLLTTHVSQKKSSQPIVKVDQEIKAIDLKERTLGVISNDKIIDLFYKSSNILKKHALDIGTDSSQTYRRNSVDLKCDRHMQIFNKFNVIPQFCFGCYKVQVEPRSVVELIKLFVVFDQIKLSKNNSRKCMVEMRSKIPGFYKGLVYCSSLEEAFLVTDHLEMAVKEKIGSGLPLTVKRGCSEYPIVFPDYKEINKSGDQIMNYNEDWKLIEEDYDSKNSIKRRKIINPSLSCLTLSDILIIRNWIDYAKGIGDSSAELLNQSGVFSQKIYKIAKTRVETHLWRE